MKVRTIKAGDDAKAGSVWCMGCGAYHVMPGEAWNGNETVPSTTRIVEVIRNDFACRFTIRSGLMVWDVTSTHRLASQSRELPHEESWRVHGPEQTKEERP